MLSRHISRERSRNDRTEGVPDYPRIFSIMFRVLKPRLVPSLHKEVVLGIALLPITMAIRNQVAIKFPLPLRLPGESSRASEVKEATCSNASSSKRNRFNSRASRNRNVDQRISSWISSLTNEAFPPNSEYRSAVCKGGRGREGGGGRIDLDGGRDGVSSRRHLEMGTGRSAGRLNCGNRADRVSLSRARARAIPPSFNSG